MPTAIHDSREPVELARSDLRGLWLMLIPVLCVGGIAALVVRRTLPAFAVSFGVAVALLLLVQAVRLLAGRNAIFVDGVGLIVVTRGRAVRSVSWDRIVRATWDPGAFWTRWDPASLVVVTDAGEEVRVGAVTIANLRSRKQVAERVAAVLASRVPPRADPKATQETVGIGARDDTSGRTRRERHAWWRDGVLYHVYLRSFADSDGDGVGDIGGLIAKLDHLAWLGVDGIWVSPVMPSPDDDFGYDIADYTDVDAQYGSLADADRLVDEAEARGMSVLFDLVPNHSSVEHPWFEESRSSRDSATRDWYIWADPKPDGAPPNNWVGNFFGPSWTFDEKTGQYYLTSFLPTQADLNWWNPEVRQAFDDALRFWFDRGVMGFRIDVVHKMIKDPALPDNPPVDESASIIERAWGQRELYNANQPETHEIIRRWRRVADAYEEPRVLIGETYVLDLPTMASYYGAGDELDLAFNIPFLWSTLDAASMRRVIEATEDALPAGAWPVWNGGSHDISRMATRWAGNDGRKIRCALMLLLMMRGTPLLYYGDEIGMPDTDVPLDRALDPLGRRVPGVVTAGRDPARTPMPWTREPGAGFTRPGVEPWLPLGDHEACNVEDQHSDPGSVLTLTRDLIALRREGAASGPRTEWIDAPAGVLAWRRGDAAIALNLSDEDAVVEGVDGHVRLGTRRERDGEAVAGSVRLEPWEGVVVYE